MKSPLQFTIVLGLAAAGMVLAQPDVNPPSKSDGAAVREAARYERAKDAAGRRQAGIEVSHPGQASHVGQTSEANRSADRLDGETPAENTPGSKVRVGDAGTVGEAVRFEKFKDVAAARQTRLDARQ
jgi:hypothetical protein